MSSFSAPNAPLPLAKQRQSVDRYGVEVEAERALDVRMKKHSESALQVARHLESRDDIEFVRYPHLESHPQYELAQRQMR